MFIADIQEKRSAHRDPVALDKKMTLDLNAVDERPV